MLPWIHSIRRVHHRSSHEYLRVVTVREEGKGETVVPTPIDQIGLMSLIDCMIIDPWASVFYLDILIVLSSVV
jgi:energy-converting hydrogenase Eha subunit C